MPEPHEESHRLAEQTLAAARQGDDPRRLALALADLGAVLHRARQGQQAVHLLAEALTLVRQLGDRAGERDVLCGLGGVALEARQPVEALQFFGQALALAEQDGDRFAAKLALERLGTAHLTLRDPGRALGFLDAALDLARDTGDRTHEAHLVWYRGIALLELGRREAALAEANAAIALLRALGNPESECFADHLQRALREDQPEWQGALVGSWESTIAPAAPAPREAGWLRKAVSAARALAQYVGSGMKTVCPEERQRRLELCTGCEHHTGVRCRLCGCFTQVKTWLPHEVCPLGKWTK